MEMYSNSIFVNIERELDHWYFRSHTYWGLRVQVKIADPANGKGW